MLWVCNVCSGPGITAMANDFINHYTQAFEQYQQQRNFIDSFAHVDVATAKKVIESIPLPSQDDVKSLHQVCLYILRLQC